MSHGKPRSLTSVQAHDTLAHRFTRRVDRIRQLNTRFGLRSKRVFLVWTRWAGVERGEGREAELARVEILPTPKLSDLSSVSKRPWSGGTLSEGTTRIHQISAGTFTKDNLTGKKIPSSFSEAPDPLPGKTLLTEDEELMSDPKIDFFWEVAEDGRGDDPPSRNRYRLVGSPNRSEDMFQWVVLLERASQDYGRNIATREQDDDLNNVVVLP